MDVRGATGNSGTQQTAGRAGTGFSARQQRAREEGLRQGRTGSLQRRDQTIRANAKCIEQAIARAKAPVAGPIAPSKAASDWLQESRAQQWNENLVYTIDSPPRSAIASAEYGLTLAKQLAPETRSIIRIPGDRDSRAETAFERRGGILHVQVPGGFQTDRKSTPLNS